MKKHTLLWKIEGKQLPAASYLFGTMHVKDKRAFRFQEQVYTKIQECTAFATEFNFEEIENGISAESMDLPDGQTLVTLIPPKKYKKINKIFKKAVGVDLAMFNTGLPILITNVLSERILSADMPHSLDMHLFQFAKEQEKITLGIETYQEQLDILKKIPIDFQIKSLLWAGKNFKRFRKQLLTTTKVYESANINKIYKAAHKSSKGLRKLLLFDRNVIMADRIAAMAKEQGIFCAIGAGHLGGKKGVIRLLKQAGLKVKPVSNPSHVNDFAQEN